MPDRNDWSTHNRPNDKYLSPRYYDAALLGAEMTEDGVTLSPLGEPALWPARQEVSTPWGTLTIECNDDGSLRFSAAERFGVTVYYQGQDCMACDSQGACEIGENTVIRERSSGG